MTQQPGPAGPQPEDDEMLSVAALAYAQQAIRDCGPEFAGVTLIIPAGSDLVYDETGECVGWYGESPAVRASAERQGIDLDADGASDMLDLQGEQDEYDANQDD